MTSLAFVRLAGDPEIDAYVLRACIIVVKVPTCILTPLRASCLPRSHVLSLSLFALSSSHLAVHLHMNFRS